MKKNSTIIFILVLVSLLVSTAAKAQTKQIIHGKVTSSSDKEALIGVSVIEFDKDNRILNGTKTDLDGNYTLKISGNTNTKITFSYIGYQTVSRTAGSSTVINVQLEDGSRTIEGATVVAKRQTDIGVGNISDKD